MDLFTRIDCVTQKIIRPGKEAMLFFCSFALLFLAGFLQLEGPVNQSMAETVQMMAEPSGNVITGTSDQPQETRRNPADRPNIIFIMTDDQGFETLQSYGGESYLTPVTDQLAATGIRFSQAHALPLCTPTRVQVMSGIYSSRNYTGFGELDPGVYTFGNLFQDAGYATFIGGKWQLGGGLQAPYHFGFDEYALWQVIGRSNRYANPTLDINGETIDFKHGEYGPDIINEYVLNFIERNRDVPFFIYYPMNLVHYPNDPTPDSEEWDPSFRRDHEQEHSKMYDFWNTNEFFGDMVAYAEKLVGNVTEKLEDAGLRKNTLLVFTSDNGTFRSITSIVNGKEFTGGKRTSTDAGTRVPLIANWPGMIPAGQVNDDLIDFTYFFPTFAEVAGIEIPERLKLDGVSIAPTLYGEDQNFPDWQYLWWSVNNSPDGFGDEFARTHRYKLYHDGRFYDLELDPLEERPPLAEGQLNSEQQQVRHRLRQVINEHTREGYWN